MTTGGLMARHEKFGPKGIRTMGTRRKILSPCGVSCLAVASVLVVVGALMLLPVAWAFVQSFELPSAQFLLPPVWFPHQLTLESYRARFRAHPLSTT